MNTSYANHEYLEAWYVGGSDHKLYNIIDNFGQSLCTFSHAFDISNSFRCFLCLVGCYGTCICTYLMHIVDLLSRLYYTKNPKYGNSKTTL